MILIPIIERDFRHADPLIQAMKRQITYYPIGAILTAYRNGMQYVTDDGDMFELSAKDFVCLKRNMPKLYCLRPKGKASLTLSAFFAKLDYAEQKDKYPEHYLDESFWDHWASWLDEQGT